MVSPDHDLRSAVAASLADHLRPHVPKGREALRLGQLRPRRYDAAAALADQGALIAASRSEAIRRLIADGVKKPAEKNKT